jgi:hypothetical protein
LAKVIILSSSDLTPWFGEFNPFSDLNVFHMLWNTSWLISF